ncbi:hypothetical protein BGZ68_000899 [Mortierella alpina]|nr:hypothetical protein BGZ68_000899 [Mortierella alpina]
MDTREETPVEEQEQEHDQDQNQNPRSPESDASTISCPNSPQQGPTRHNEQAASEELASIQEELQTVLEYVDHGMILKSFDALSRLTDIAVTNCEKLGLASDGGAIDQKAGFWTGLNNCWLFAFSHYGNARSEDQRVREHHLHHLHNNVKAWADALEKYGLVNYELGLWEQDILEAIEVCLINTSVFATILPATSPAIAVVEGMDKGDNDDED